MKKFVFSTMAGLCALGVQAQLLNTNLTFAPGNLVVMRGGDGVAALAAGNKQNPMALVEYDPAAIGQASPMVEVVLPTNNGTASMWLNASAGSEGIGITRSADRRVIAVTGYTSPINEALGTPSSATLTNQVIGGTQSPYPAFNRGIAFVDAFTNYVPVYSDPFNWFGLVPGVSQNNPRGIATVDGTNFWGGGTVAGTATNAAGATTSYQASGNLFYNQNDYSILGDPPIPTPIQTLLASCYQMKIINNVLYAVAKQEAGGGLNNGIYTFSTYVGGNPDPLPWMPGVSPYEGIVETTNLFCNFGTNANILAFDMDPANTTVYAADTKGGIVKFTGNGAGTFVQQYIFAPTNMGTIWTKGSQGAFGIAVDFSQSTTNYNVIYATTLEEGDGSTISSNRLIRIVDTGAPGNNLVAQTLATAPKNEDFRGLDFSPDLRPAFTTQPLGTTTGTNDTLILSTTVQASYPVNYQWQYNGVNLSNATNYSGATTGTLTLSHTITNLSGNFTLIASDYYGSVTSVVAAVNISAVPILPGHFAATVNRTNYIGDTVIVTANPQTGNQPFNYQWYFGNTQLNDDGVKYYGSTGPSLSITNVQLQDSGAYKVVVSNVAGAVTNTVENLTVKFLSPSVSTQPSALVLLAGQSDSLTISAIGTTNLIYQWDEGNVGSGTSLSDTGVFTGSASSTLTLTGVTPANSANYYCVVTNNGGSATSLVASVTVIVPPAYSFLAYSNQIYYQNFDSLPNPGGFSVNTVAGGGLTEIPAVNGTFYNVANPFDFAYPTYTNLTLSSGGLNLPNTMSGWYGECDADGNTGGQIGAQAGDQTTGGVISFGSTNINTGNRALGLVSTSTSGGSHFGLKLVNTSSTTLNYLNLSYLGEFWKQGTKPKTLQFSYLIDTASSTFNSAEIASAQANLVTNLNLNFPVGKVGPANGSLPQSQENQSVTNLAIGSWTPGSALWLVWSINDATGSGQGYAIDNLELAASATPGVALVPVSTPTLGTVSYNGGSGLSFTFTNTPGGSGQFTAWSTTNLALPFSAWTVIGHPTETSAGSYQVVDPSAATNAHTFYRVTSP